MDNSEHWGLNVLRLRKERGWTQADLAQRSGVPESRISKIENGKQGGGSLKVVQRLARALGVSVEELTGAPKSPLVQQARNDYMTEFNRLRLVLPPPVKVYESIASAEKGGRIVSTVFVARQTPTDEDSMFGVVCPRKCLPLLMAGKQCVAIIDRRHSDPHDGDVVLWEDGAELKAGVYHQLGQKRWTENACGTQGVDGLVLWKILCLEIDLSEGLAS